MLGQRVVYACPTKQLARQVLQKASAQGLQAALLIGSHWDWDQAELAQYTRGDAIAITTYSAIFNLNSYLDDAQTLVFDDAHAAEGYVAEAWALSVGREMIQYEQLVDALGDSVEPSFVARMMAPAGPAADGREVRLIPIGAVARHAEDIDRVLAGLHGDPSYRFRMVRARIRPGQADRLDQRFMPGAREHDHIPGVRAARQDLLLHGAGRYRLAWHSPVASARPAGVRLACTGSGSWMRQAGTGSVCGPGQVASPGCR